MNSILPPSAISRVNPTAVADVRNKFRKISPITLVIGFFLLHVIYSLNISAYKLRYDKCRPSV